MLPYRIKNAGENVPPSTFQINSNNLSHMNVNNMGLPDHSASFHVSTFNNPRNVNFSGNRIASCRPSTITHHSSNLNINIPQSPEGLVGSNKNAVEPSYQVQFNSNLASHWQNQQMNYEVLSVPVGHNIPSSILQRNKILQSELTQNAVSSGAVQKNKAFQFTQPAVPASNEKESLKKTLLKKDVLFDCRHLVGSVEQVIRWYQIARSFSILPIYEVHGVLESKQTKPRGVVLIMIRQLNGGSSLQGIFCAIDRPFPPLLQPGDNIVCVGEMKGAKKIQIFNAWKETAKPEDYTRISFLCQRALTEFIFATPEP